MSDRDDIDLERRESVLTTNLCFWYSSYFATLPRILTFTKTKFCRAVILQGEYFVTDEVSLFYKKTLFAFSLSNRNVRIPN